MKLRRIEFILATVIYLFILAGIYGNGERYPGNESRHFYYMGMASIVYLAFLLFNFVIAKDYFTSKRYELGILYVFFLFFFTWSSLTGIVLWMEKKGDFGNYLINGLSLGVSLGAFFVFLFYAAIKAAIIYSIEQPQKSKIMKQSLLVLGFWLLSYWCLLVTNSWLASYWFVLVPFIYVLFALNVYWLVPYCDRKKYGLLPFVARAAMLSLLLCFLSNFFYSLTNSGASGFPLLFGITLLSLGFLSYFYYARLDDKKQIRQVKLQLGTTSADLSFLRSQINPHFLFNILNTLYGIALVEHASRTAEGIQRLGDMMRFMLHENIQDKILLAREIDYLRNYVELQRLRYDASMDIAIACDIREVLEGTYIAPMLFIPFVENAFKHGVSLREKSWINISLYESDGTVYFDVHNSIHPKPDCDPEESHSGVGLENVKQRLTLLYANKHELVIRKTTQEYFVHLTVQL